MTAIKEVHDKVNGLKEGYSMMECPWCKGDDNKVYDKSKQSWKFDKWVTPVRARYVCGLCNLGVQYEL